MKFKVGQAFRKDNNIGVITKIILMHTTQKFNYSFAWYDTDSKIETELKEVDTKTVILIDRHNKRKRTKEHQYVLVYYGDNGSYFNIGRSWVEEIEKEYKVKDTPMELIEVGDGVKFNRPMYHNDLVDVKKINKHNEGFEDERTDLIFSQTSCDLGEVVAIYTLQGKDYICQWEAE